MIGDFTSQAFNSSSVYSIPIEGVNTIEFSGQSPASGAAAPVDESFLLGGTSTSTWIYIGAFAIALYVLMNWGHR